MHIKFDQIHMFDIGQNSENAITLAAITAFMLASIFNKRSPKSPSHMDVMI